MLLIGHGLTGTILGSAGIVIGRGWLLCDIVCVCARVLWTGDIVSDLKPEDKESEERERKEKEH